jgi:hypothetical protein
MIIIVDVIIIIKTLHRYVSRVVHLSRVVHIRCAHCVRSTRELRSVISRDFVIIMTWLCQYNFSYQNTDPGISSTHIAHNIVFHFYRRCNI